MFNVKADTGETLEEKQERLTSADNTNLDEFNIWYMQAVEQAYKTKMGLV